MQAELPARPGRPAPLAPLLAATASVLLVLMVAVLGPSAAEPPLPGPGLLPLSFAASPPAALVMGLLAAATLLGAVGIAGCWRAVRTGWSPDPRRLLATGALGAALLAVVPPVGSADPLSYAAYGRMAVTGHDPYATTPRTLAAAGDPVARAVEAPWQDSPSVYGPLATAEQRLVSQLAGRSVRTAVALLGLLNALAFVLTGLLLDRLVNRLSGPHGRRRSALLWTANPLLLQQLVAGAHLDAVVALAVVAGLAAVGATWLVRPRATRRVPSAAPAPAAPPGRMVAAGALIGAGVAVKAPAALVGAGLAWALRTDPRRLAALALGALAVVVPAYLSAGPHVLDQLRRASRYVSGASPWRPVASVLDRLLGLGPSRTLLGLLALLLGALLALALARGLPGRAPGVLPSGVRAATVLTIAYLFAAPYVLPWYDAVAWSLLALLPWSPYDGILLVRTAVLALAYLPGRVVPLPPVLHALGVGVRGGLAPVVLLVLVGWILYRWRAGIPTRR